MGDVTSTLDRVARARANAIGLTEEAPDRPKRKRGRIVGGVVLAVVSGWLAAAVFTSVSSREDVVALRREVPAFQELTADDLQVVQVASSPEVSFVSGEDLDDLVGRVAATTLVEGSVLHGGQLLEVSHEVVGPREGVVGAVLGPEDAPAGLAAGMDVEVVVRPAGTDGMASTLRGWLLEVDEADLPGAVGQRVSLVVPGDRVASVSTAAADGHVSVAILGGG